ncbi:spore-associated protein A [Salininema proteolyticum]|uniref:Spore-associated protein A n=1 Tax=Salininema proteolyticum TaxID=1607685 RepID=A0ABV8TZU2_9ACTN
MKKFRRLAVAAAALGAAFALSPVLTGTAAAANVCGSSFGLVGSYDKSGNGHSGRLEVYYSSSYRQNCAVLVNTSSDTGSHHGMGVQIKPTGGSVASPGGTDEGRYLSYAGPVYTSASVDMSGRCVDVKGYIADELFQTEFVSWNLSGAHCG